ncbi:hypothetical protein ACQ4PT_070083 [Festuca glaucescens]
MESMKKELKDHIDTQLALVPKRCAEEVLKMLNKNGVMYKPVEGSESDKGGDEEEDDSIHIDESSKKEFMYKTSSNNTDALISNLTKNSYKYVTPPKHNGVQEAGDKVYVTPENVGNTEGIQDNPFVINDTTKPASSSEVPDDIFARSTTKVNAGQKDDLHDGEDEVMSTDSVETMGGEATRKKGNRTKCANSNARRRNAAVQVAGKRKRMTNQKYGSPYVVAKPSPKRRSRVKKEHEVGVSSAVPTPQEIEAAALYVKTISKIPKQASKGVYKNEFGATLSSQRLNIVLAHEWLSDDVIGAAIGYLSLRVGPDRMLCPAWRTNYLLELAEKQYRRKYTIKNIDDVVKRSGAIGRVMDEYFKREKTFFPLNIRKTHYVTVVMHTTKKEFQVLDPLFGLGVSKSVVEDLIGQISLHIQEANKTSETEYPDVEE